MNGIRNLALGVAICCVLSISISAQERQGKLSQISFYEGSVKIDFLTGTLILQDGRIPQSNIRVGLSNTSQTQQRVAIGFRDSEDTVLSLGPREHRALVLAPQSTNNGKPRMAQSVVVDLALELDRLPSAQAIDSIDLVIQLPHGVPALMRSNVDLIRKKPEGTTDTLVSYRVAKSNYHPVPLTLSYNAGPVTLEISKVIQPPNIGRPGPVEVILTIRNLGRGVAEKIKLEDTYDPRDFSGSGQGFEIYAGKENDRRLIWTLVLDRIPAGSSETVRYTLKAENAVRSVTLGATTARIGGQLVGVSNKIVL